MFMLRLTIFLCLLCLSHIQVAYAWYEEDKGAYLEKMEILRVLVKEAASKPDGLREMCLLMSIGNDVNSRYLELNRGDKEEAARGSAMADQLTVCLAAMYLKDKQPIE